AFYAQRMPEGLCEEETRVMRQAYAGLLWTKQFYHYIVSDWLNGDPEQPAPPEARKLGRNYDWGHVYSRDVISMPDKWEYPWFAAWDLAFHMIPFARIDAKFAKEQLLLFLREWYQHPNGALPAYEFALSDVNPPVHAWACWRVYKMTAPQGKRDRVFLVKTFQKLLLNFTWWVNRKDDEGNHIFAGGFLGLDNIGVFDRSKPLPTGGKLDQADGTAWMAFYCGTMLSIAMELAREDTAYEDIAFKFFRHFIDILDASNTLGGNGLWHEEDGFYYDHLRIDGRLVPLKIRSLVGLVPLIAVETLADEDIKSLPEFSKRVNWFLEHRKDLARHVAYLEKRAAHGYRLLAIPSRERLVRVLRYVLDEEEFLSPYGIRSLSKYHEKNPYTFWADGREYRVPYTPGESDTYVFGGNSNWRGPIWFPLNYLIVEALERYYHFYGDSLTVECPTGSGNMMHLGDVAKELTKRHTKLFLSDANGKRPYEGEMGHCGTDPDGEDMHLFYEYFHADTGRGLGASHQTGWTALVARFIEKTHRELGDGSDDD
ncbi:MAG: MGH1-like glycoside hydrolase domain-containing protein, partial [Candidatus Latescibacterota bacterium]